MLHLVIADPDLDWTDMLASHLSGDGYSVDVVRTLSDAIEVAETRSVDLYIVGVRLGLSSGLDLLGYLRRHGNTPVILSGDLPDEHLMIMGLIHGADDYLVKPSSMSEVSARVIATLRRSNLRTGEVPEPALRIGRLTMYANTRRVNIDGVALSLTSSEFNLLLVLARHAGQTVSKEALMRDALGKSGQRQDRSIEIHISRLREKLGSLRDGRSWIQTVFRQGYQLIWD